MLGFVAVFAAGWPFIIVVRPWLQLPSVDDGSSCSCSTVVAIADATATASFAIAGASTAAIAIVRVLAAAVYRQLRQQLVAEGRWRHWCQVEGTAAAVEVADGAAMLLLVTIAIGRRRCFAAIIACAWLLQWIRMGDRDQGWQVLLWTANAVARRVRGE